MSELTKYRDAVLSIKNAILQSRYQAARLANKEQLMLYYGIGRYVSDNTRSGKWGTGAVEEISRQLQSELPGLRGFSATTMKYMRTFFEKWSEVFELNRPLSVDDLAQQNSALAIRPLSMDELQGEDVEAFLQVGFTHHREILLKCERWDERWYYIKRCAAEFWSVEKLKSRIRANDFVHQDALANNFSQTMPNANFVSRAVRSFKDAKKAVVELSVQDYNRPMGVAVYRTPGDIPKEYQSLKSLMEGVQEILESSPDIESDQEKGGQ
jgi:predicted nuclease of restriction endonuclease-like (RecB) superfamily